MTSLPVELMSEILLRLPAKSLLRYKVVCKLWYNLIRRDAQFVSLHLERSIATKTNLHVVYGIPKLYLADFDTFENGVALNYPLSNHALHDVVVLDSCHGLFCLKLTCHDYDGYVFDIPLLLYNPTTQTHKYLPRLPRPEFAYFGDNDCNFGFGFDSASSGYKCVSIIQNCCLMLELMEDFETTDYRCQVMVYSLETDIIWRKGPDLPHYFRNPAANGVLLHEAVHWVGYGISHGSTRVEPKPVVVFNFQDETFRLLALPDFEARRPQHLNTNVLDGCLCLLANSTDGCDVWVMQEYGMAGSWKRLFTVVEHLVMYPHSQFYKIISYSRSGNGLFLMLSGTMVVYLDLGTLKITAVAGCSDAHLCVENLLEFDHAN